VLNPILSSNFAYQAYQGDGSLDILITICHYGFKKKGFGDMPRSARKKSATGVYHVIVRGINRQNIFCEEEDFYRYLKTLERTMTVSAFELLAYCLMENHVHLLIKEEQENLGQIMKRIGSSYAYWYNCKYQRTGHVFQDRYKSEPVEDDKYLITVIRYIHNNPIKAGMVTKPEQYRWSSCSKYYGEKENISGLTKTDFVLSLFSEKKNLAIKEFRQFMQQAQQEIFLDDERTIRISDEELTQIIKDILKGKPITALQQMERAARDSVLHQAKQIAGSSIRQISRVSGIGYNIVIRA
jgi:REP element-mobilizing transposase RayT